MVNGNIYVKIHESGGNKVLAACDEDLLGKVIITADLEFHVSSSFYGGELVDREGLLYRLQFVNSANLVGSEVINIALEAGMVDEGSITYLSGIPHVQIYFIF